MRQLQRPGEIREWSLGHLEQFRLGVGALPRKRKVTNTVNFAIL